jgi:hypothetical protein
MRQIFTLCLSVHSCAFLDLDSEEAGGALHFQADSVDSAEAVDSVFVKCRSAESGGAVFVSAPLCRFNLGDSFGSDCPVSPGTFTGHFCQFSSLSQCHVVDCSILRCPSDTGNSSPGGLYFGGPNQNIPLSLSLLNFTGCEVEAYGAGFYRYAADGGCLCAFMTVSHCSGDSMIVISDVHTSVVSLNASNFYNNSTPDRDYCGLIVAAGCMIYLDGCYFMECRPSLRVFAANRSVPGVENWGAFRYRNCHFDTDFVEGQDWINPAACGEACDGNIGNTLGTTHIAHTRTDLMGRCFTDPPSPAFTPILSLYQHRRVLFSCALFTVFLPHSQSLKSQ